MQKPEVDPYLENYLKARFNRDPKKVPLTSTSARQDSAVRVVKSLRILTDIAFRKERPEELTGPVQKAMFGALEDLVKIFAGLAQKKDSFRKDNPPSWNKDSDQ